MISTSLKGSFINKINEVNEINCEINELYIVIWALKPGSFRKKNRRCANPEGWSAEYFFMSTAPYYDKISC